MTQFAIYLNEMTPGLKERLPPTDSRLRPDQHALEEGVFDQVIYMCSCLLTKMLVTNQRMGCRGTADRVLVQRSA